MEIQAFANASMRDASPGFFADGSVPAMTTPLAVAAAEFVVVGSTICLVC